MVPAGVSMHGKTYIIFIDLRKPKSMESITSACYATSSFPNVVNYPDDNYYIFQQDNAPSHLCRLAQQFLQANTPDFIHSDAWPPNSPDLNSLDYYVWNDLKELVCWSQKTVSKC